MERQWVRLDPKKLSTTRRRRIPTRESPEAIEDVQVELSMSPYDVPVAFRGYYDESIERLVIEFRYIGQESWSREPSEEHFWVRIGDNSGRLHGIEIDVNALKAKVIRLQMQVLAEDTEEAIDHFMKHRTKPSRWRNYRAAKDVISSHQADIFQSLEPA